ncbi:MAG: FAD-dependent oxidoreductase [Chitinophagaceae bacterium]|jgi:glycine/D-amino acid oxidase-like deaminating enzyme
MHKDILIIGQGIAGTLLSYELMCEGKSVMVIDTPDKHKASLVAAAVINPLIGKNWTIAKDAAMLIPHAVKTYKALGEKFEQNFLIEKDLFVFHQNVKQEQTFADQISDGNSYLHDLGMPETDSLKQFFFADDKIGKVNPVYTVEAASLLRQWTSYIQAENSFETEKFDMADLKISTDRIAYKGISADKIVFCEGAAGRNNPLFPHVNFTTNRGDVLLLSIPELTTNHLYQKGIRLVPRSDGLFWCGSNYTWKYDSLLPDKNWRSETEAQLKNWLKLPFEMTDHLVAERPTTAGQQTLLLQSELHKNVYFFNGLGTRGFSAGPFLANKMAQLLNH